MRVAKSCAFRSKFVQVRRGDLRLGIQRTDIAITHVVREDKHDIGLVRVKCGGKEAQQEDVKQSHGAKLSFPVKLCHEIHSGFARAESASIAS